MKRRLVPAAAAALLAVGIALPLTAKPANAQVNPVQVISAINAADSLVSKFLATGLTLQQAVDQIKTAIAQSQTVIVDEIDQVAAASVKSCAESAVINYADIDALTPDSLQTYALDMTTCVTQADSLLGTLTDKAAIDDVGFALESVAPLAVMGRAKAGLSTSALLTAIINASNTDISELAPSCVDWFWTDDGGVEYENYECDAYDGTVATGTRKVHNAQGVTYPGTIDYVGIQNQATANTSRAAAQTAVASF
jgi:hypothetical protein